ncbi:YadA C-terminal domain-containing protein [Gallibacterium anatis]|nr:YadA C-terminal domain-containing protein [Gallibacterium anatis]
MLPQPRNAGGAMVSAATTNYRGEQALAVGFSKVSDNGKHIIKLSGASNASGKKDMMVGAAYGFEW